jgi:hypothetical protein
MTPPLMALFVGWLVVMALRYGPRASLWWGWFASMLLVPVWVFYQIRTTAISVRNLGVIIPVLCFMLLPLRKNLFRQMVFLDLLVFGYLITLNISLFMSDSLVPLAPVEIGRVWLLPYLAGRLFLGAPSELPSMLKVFVPLIMLLVLYAAIEAITHTNIVNSIKGMKYYLLEQGEGYRWGLKRAQGFSEHPIYLGLTLVMLLPMSIVALASRYETGYSWWRFVPLVLGLGIFVTVSRGAFLAGFMVLYCFWFFRYPRLRSLLLSLALVSGITAYAFKDVVLYGLSVVVGEKVADPEMVVIDGKEYAYTGTIHRQLLDIVYREAIENAGLFGYGPERLRMPVAHAPSQFKSIDDHYLLFYLQYGAVGVMTFIGLGICGLYYLARIAWNPERPFALLAAGTFGSVLSVMVVIRSVSFEQDFGAVWLFSLGLAAAMYRSHLDNVPDRMI